MLLVVEAIFVKYSYFTPCLFPQRRYTRRASTVEIMDVAASVHWAVVATLLVGTALGMAATQNALSHQHHRRVFVQMLGSPNQVTLLLAVLYAYAMGFVVAAVAPTMPCLLYAMWAQVFAAATQATLVYRTLHFTLKLARLERAKVLLRVGGRRSPRRSSAPAPPTEVSDDGSPPSPAARRYRGSSRRTTAGEDMSPDKRRALRFADRVVRLLDGRRIPAITATSFAFGAVVLFIVEPSNFRAGPRSASDTACTARASAYCFAAWFLWIVPYFYLFRGFNLKDPFRIWLKLKVQTAALMALAAALLAVWGHRNHIPSPHFQLALYDVAAALQITFWITESVIPLWLTGSGRSSGRGTGGRRANGYTGAASNVPPTVTEKPFPLAAILAYAPFLALFEEHLIEEWSPENLHFYKRALVYRLRNTFSRNSGAMTGGEASDADATAASSASASPGPNGGDSVETRLSDRRLRKLNALRRQALEIYNTYLARHATYQVCNPFVLLCVPSITTY